MAKKFHLLTKCDVCAKFELCRLLGGPARESDARTDAQTPGEYIANSGPAGLVPVPELSNTNEPNETSKVIEKKPFSSRIFKK